MLCRKSLTGPESRAAYAATAKRGKDATVRHSDCTNFARPLRPSFRRRVFRFRTLKKHSVTLTFKRRWTTWESARRNGGERTWQPHSHRGSLWCREERRKLLRFLRRRIKSVL